MRVIILLFFLIISPFAVLLATILYGGVSTEVIKEELTKSGIYKKIEFPPLTPSYVSAKVEKAIDDSTLWITGKTDTAPVISFKDIKEEFIAENPDFQDALDEMEQMPVDEAEASDYGEGEDPQAFMKDLAKNDFSYSLKDTLSGLKFGHSVISILLPVLAVLMVLSIVGIILMSPDNKSKFRWVGVTFLLSAVGGFILFFVFQFVVTVALAVLTENSNSALRLVTPIVERVAIIFLDKNREIQALFSFAAGVLGVVCFASSFAFGKEIVSKPRPKQRKTT